VAKRALCVGINDYPGADMDLGGCLNDAKDWEGLLQARGYSVERLLDAEATRARMLSALEDLMAPSAEGDSLVFTFSGHGSWLPDDDSDEPDSRDEMLCPHDVMQDQFVLDDDLHAVFSRKAAEARLYMIADCCHSGTVVRYAGSPAQPDPAPIKARFLPPYLLARGDRTMERAIDRAAKTPATTKQGYPALLFSGCQDTEFSYDTSFNGRPNGAFTRVAIEALADPGVKTPRDLHDAVRKRLPSPSLPQTPQLFGSRSAKLGPLF
jgi:hypothetical protein